jgi:hypothetical protein
MGFISLIITIALVPGWVEEFVNSLFEYRKYAETVTGAEKLFGKGVVSLVSWLAFGLAGLFMMIICYKTNRKSLHLICFSYLLILQGLIFPSFSYALLMGIPIVALGMKQAIFMWKNGQNYKSFIIVFNLLLIFCMMMAHWLVLLSRSVNYAKIVDSYYIIIKKMSLETPFVILPLMLGLGIIIFIINYYSQKDNIGDPEIGKLI